MDLRALAKSFWRWRIVFLLVTVLVPVGAYLYTSSQDKVYRAFTSLQVGTAAVDTSLFTDISIGSSAATNQQSLATLARLIHTTAVAREAAKFLHPPPSSPSDLLGAVSVEPDATANLINITADARSPQRAADIANAFAKAVVARQAHAAVARLDGAIEQLRAQLATFPAGDVVGKRQLSQQLQRLRALRAAQGNNAVVVEPAVPPSSQISPRPVRTTVLAFILGLLLAIGAVLLAENLDRRIRQPGQLEELSGLPLLAVIPETAFGTTPGTGPAEDAFRTLRATLTYFNVDRPLDSLVVTSPGPGDGKTTVATNLAYSLAKSGKAVVLVDADLRRPRIANVFGVVGSGGLGAVLAGEIDLDDALTEIEVPGVTQGGRLSVLPAGGAPPNPAELLGSQHMLELHETLVERADVVVFDTPPVLTVSDAFPLLERSSGVILVARLNGTRRDPLTRLRGIISGAQGTPLGVVATGAKHSRLGDYDGYGRYDYGYGYGYGSGDEERPRSLRDILRRRRRPEPELPEREVSRDPDARPAEREELTA